MTRWVLATGDFTTWGGMDRANHALASYLARSGREVHLVAHRGWRAKPRARCGGLVERR